MFDMCDIAFLLNKVMNIRKVIAPVQAHVLLNSIAIGTRQDNGNDHFIDQPFIMGIGTRYINRQWSTSAIYQNMYLTAAFGSVHRTLARFLTTQRRWTRFAVNGLPSPSDSTPSLIK